MIFLFPGLAIMVTVLADCVASIRADDNAAALAHSSESSRPTVWPSTELALDALVRRERS